MGFDHNGLVELGRKVRDLYARGQPTAERIHDNVDDAYIASLATAVTGTLGGKVGVAPRIYLKKLVGDVLDRVDQFEEFDPRVDYQLTVGIEELTDEERNASAGLTADDIELDLTDEP
jgi:hypothetical protein